MELAVELQGVDSKLIFSECQSRKWKLPHLMPREAHQKVMIDRKLPADYIHMGISFFILQTFLVIN